VLEKEGEDQLDGSNEKLSSIIQSWRKGTSHMQYKEGRLTGWDIALELPSKTRYSREDRRDRRMRKKTKAASE